MTSNQQHPLLEAPPAIRVALPNGSHITSTAATALDIPLVPVAATVAHIFPALQPHSLLSIGQLCDAGCEAKFTAHDVSITHEDNIIITGQRDPTTSLWNVQIPTTNQHER